MLGPSRGINLKQPSTPCQQTRLILLLRVCLHSKQPGSLVHRLAPEPMRNNGESTCADLALLAAPAPPQDAAYCWATASSSSLGQAQSVCALERLRSPAAVGGAPDDPRVTAWLACDPLAPLAMLGRHYRAISARPRARPTAAIKSLRCTDV